MTLGKTFRNQPERTVVSFTFKELATKTGIIVLSGYSSETSVGVDYHLTSDQTVYSTTIEDTIQTNPANWTTLWDRDFDAPVFKTSITLKGIANIIFALKAGAGAGGSSAEIKADVKIAKWDGTTETIIVSVTTPTLATGTGGLAEIMNVPLTIPKTHFKKDDTLRVIVDVQARRNGGTSDCTFGFGHDPRNRDATFIIPSTDDPDSITKLLTYIPFDII